MPIPTVITDLNTTISANSPAGTDVPGTIDDFLRAHAGFIAQLRNGAAFTGTVSAPTAFRQNGATQGSVGVRVGAGTGQTASNSWNDIVLDVPSVDAGMSILSSVTANGALVFGDTDNAIRGKFQYSHATDKASIWAAGVEVVDIDSAGMSVVGKINAVVEGAGSGQAANSNYNNIVIDSDGTAGMTVLSGPTSSGGYRFGRLGSNAVGSVNYDHATDTMALVAGGSTVVSLNTGVFQVAVGMEATSLSTTSGGISSSGSIGFSFGTGGSVTQATSKSTAVTLNKHSGKITMNGAALAGGAAVSFTLNNSILRDSSVVNVCIRSGCTTGGSYAVIADSVSVAGTCRISVRNLTAGSLSEALVLTFAVIGAEDI